VLSGYRSHPDDLRLCSLTGIPFHVEFATLGDNPYLQPLGDLLHGVRHRAKGLQALSLLMDNSCPG
jgi:hypothetical protein